MNTYLLQEHSDKHILRWIFVQNCRNFIYLPREKMTIQVSKIAPKCVKKALLTLLVVDFLNHNNFQELILNK